jgi:transcriptional regulator with XRE-family HTH domain
VGNGWDANGFKQYILAAAANLPAVETQADIARVTGVTPSLLSKWFRGVEQPSLPSLRRVAEGLRVPLVDLIRLSGRADDLDLDERPMPPAPVLSDPLARLIDQMLDVESPLSQADRDYIRTVVERVVEPYRRAMRRRRTG